MTNSFSLDDIRQAAIRKYSPVEVELSDGSTVELKSLLKLRKKTRQEINDAIDEINAIDGTEDEDEELIAEWSATICESIEKVFRLACNSPRKLLAELDHDDPEIKASMYTSLFTRWISETQAGEAVSSPS